MADELAGQAKDSSQTLADLKRVADATLSHMSVEDMLGELLDRITAILGSDTSAILLLDEDRDVLVAMAAKGIEEEVRRGVTIPVGRGFAGRIAAQREPIAIEDVDHAEILNPTLRERGIRSLLGVPLLVEGNVVGVLHVGTLERRQFTEEDARLLQLAADRAALAVDHARFFEQRRLAEALQRALLPGQLPAAPGVELFSRYRPATTAAHLGGDWYDVFGLPDGRLAAVIGDVVGRGVQAAALMAQVRTAVRAYAIEGHGLSAVAERLNDLLRQAGGTHTATMIYLAVDHETGRAEVVSAGHLPPLLIGDGGAKYLDVDSGPPLGAARVARYTEVAFELPVGTTLLLYTDGLIERRDESIERGLDRLREAAARISADPAALCDGLISELATDSDQEDDIALMALRLTPIGARLELELPTEPEVLARLRRHIGRWLNEHGAEPDDAYGVVLACSEVAANAVEHAYGPGHGTFRVRADFLDGEITVAVTDEGRWRPERTGDRGRGLMLVHKLVDSVTVDSKDGAGTTVIMRHRITGGHS